MNINTNETSSTLVPQAPQTEISSTRRPACFAALAAAATFAIIVSGCNATQGFGKDLEETGQNIDHAAANAKNN
ncbi:MAG: hypothetical protein ACREJD_17425 [Phycisphaerales bacterium]